MFRHTLLGFALSAAVLSSSAFAGPVSREDVARHYATVVEASYADTLTSASLLRDAIHAFVATPSEATLASARQAWLAAREPYGQTEAFRFYSGPIDDAKGPEGRINAWPLDEAYIDSVKGKASSGIINNRKIVLSKDKLAALNERGGEENISTGYHAIEFLLWGQDFDANGPGKRSWNDFVDGQAANADRRRDYLKIIADLLVEDIASVAKAWQAGSTNYRAKFEKDPDALRKMMVGIGVLSRAELAGERMEVALDSKNQEDEHSCFSDNTHRDILTNALGIRNVWLGEYKRLDGSVLKGPSLRDLVADKDAKAADKVSADMDATLAAAEGIKAPFDRRCRRRRSASSAAGTRRRRRRRW